MATSYRAISEARSWSDRDLKLVRVVAQRKRGETAGGGEGHAREEAKGTRKK